MSSISENLETIRTAVYGKDMRGPIYESIRELDEKDGTISLYIEENIEELSRRIDYVFASISECVKTALDNLHIGYDKTDNQANVDDLPLANGFNPYYELTDFDPDTDVLFVWKNTTELIPSSDYGIVKKSSFVTLSEGEDDNFCVVFLFAEFESGDKLEFVIYKPTSGGLAGETTKLLDGTASGSVGGVATPIEDEED